MEVVLYARAGCHLCDAAREVILTQRERTPFAFEEIDIETSETLVREYGLRIPVVVVEDVERFEYEVDPAVFAALVSA